ncbi:class I SAM-dependent methyltransferase [bacterium]|nr:class I SAM-dependent methyltransferase [bacterium]
MAPDWAQSAERRGVWRRCVADPGLALHERELALLRDLRDRSVCVLGSGDNEVVFALAGMGAQVTSVDISEEQLDIARQRAESLGLHIAFLRADVTDLSAIPDGTFDLVYTGGHVAVWVSDLRTYYAEATRILRPGGRLVVSEYHPFRRVFGSAEDRLEVEYSYFDRGPHPYDSGQTDSAGDDTPLVQYEFHWTVSDMVTAILSAGCVVDILEEFDDGREEWETAPLTGLPLVLLISGTKQ